jgi:hypothetical protein
VSESRQQLVALELPGAAVVSAAVRLERWLRDQGWIGEPCETDFLYRRSATFTLGPAGQSRCTTPGSGGTVSVDPGPELWSGSLNEAGPVCPRCGHDEGEEMDAELGTSWLESGEEPVHQCPSCASSDLLGDWDLTEASAVGPAAVILDGDCSFEIKDVLLAELRSGFGGRWAYVHLHL